MEVRGDAGRPASTLPVSRQDRMAIGICQHGTLGRYLVGPSLPVVREEAGQGVRISGGEGDRVRVDDRRVDDGRQRQAAAEVGAAPEGAHGAVPGRWWRRGVMRHAAHN